VGYLSQISVTADLLALPTLYRWTLAFTYYRLPFYELLAGNLAFLTVGALAILAYSACLAFAVKPGQKLTIADNTARHLICLLFILAGTLAWGFYLDHYELRLFDARRGFTEPATQRLT